MKIKSVESYTDKDKNPIRPELARYKIVSTFNKDNTIDKEMFYSKDGFDIPSKDSVIIVYEKATEEFKEEDHPRDEDGTFTNKDGGDSGSDKPKRNYSVGIVNDKKKLDVADKVLNDLPDDFVKDYKIIFNDSPQSHQQGNWQYNEVEININNIPDEDIASVITHELGHANFDENKEWDIISVASVAMTNKAISSYSAKFQNEVISTQHDFRDAKQKYKNLPADASDDDKRSYRVKMENAGIDYNLALKRYAHEFYADLQSWKLGHPPKTKTDVSKEEIDNIVKKTEDALKNPNNKQMYDTMFPFLAEESICPNCGEPKEVFIESKEQPKNNDIKQWITVKGNHIPIKKGQNKDDAIADFFDKSKEKKDVKSYKADTLKKVEPKKEIKEKQDKINKTVTDKVEEAIKELGIEDKIYDVAMQGSYEKGTDLPESGSDMDLFVVFKTDVPQEERDKFGLEIGRKVLNKDFAESQGWTDYYDEEVTATSKYVQAFFKDGKQDVEVQIVPTRHLTLEQIKEKKLNGEDIDIGMERTPHQTEYMKEALKGKEGEVRVLKKFMKEAGLYGSNLKEMGFSGYSAEVLIDQFGSFENVIDFFADLKEGDIVDKQGGGKRNKENAFSMIDPIDPNRDLVSAFSTQKIGKTINVAKYFKETGKIPKTKYREMDSATITFDSDESNEDKLIGQVRRLAKSYQEQLGKMGFEVNTKEETINGIKVEVPDFSFESEWDNDKQKNTVKINFGTNTKTIPKEYKDKGVDLDRERAIDGYKKANSGLKFVEEDGKLKAIKERQFTDIADAIKYLMNTEGKIVKSNQNEFIKNNGRTSTGKSKFEEI